MVCTGLLSLAILKVAATSMKAGVEIVGHFPGEVNPTREGRRPMQFLCAIVVLLAPKPAGAAEGVTAGGRLEGRIVHFPAGGLAEGVKATVALLESCCHCGEGAAAPYTEADLKKARRGDNVRLKFGKPISVVVLGKEYRISELVFTQPLNTGVFWLRAGDKVVRCSKYEFRKEQRFETWRRQARPVEKHQ